MNIDVHISEISPLAISPSRHLPVSFLHSCCTRKKHDALPDDFFTRKKMRLMVSLGSIVGD
jgi:hypothetical protein